MHLFEALVILHVIAGTIGLVAFWVPIAARKGAKNHRKGGKFACYGFIAAGALAVAMGLISLFVMTDRHPEIADRALYQGLFGWMMLYLGVLTIGFADYGLAVVKHSRRRDALRAPRYQMVMGAVVAAALACGLYGFTIAEPLMMAVAALGIVSMAIQQVFVWRGRLRFLSEPAPTAYIGEHFRALIGMGISAYTAFMSVGLIRLVPEHVFNPAIWAVPSVIGVSLIIWFTHQGKQRAKRAARVQSGSTAKAEQSSQQAA